MNRVEVCRDSPTELAYMFHCPGCKCGHLIPMTGPDAHWTFNGDLEHPTFSPSYLVGKDHPEMRCHSYVENGKIRFLNDCAHELRGKTVDLGEPW